MATRAQMSEIAERSVNLIDEATRTGQMRLPNGRIVTLDVEALVRLIQWAATQRDRKPKFLESPEDIDLKETRRGT